MSLASRLITALVGLLLIWFFWPFGGGDEVVKLVEPPPTGHQRLFTTKLPEDDRPTVAPQPKAKTETKTEAATDSKSPEATTPKDTTPEDMTPDAKTSEDKTPKDETSENKTSEDRAPEDQKTAVVAVTPKLKPKRFYRVRVLDGGTLEASGFVIKLDGISPVPSDETCKDSSGAKWLCGTRARVALTRFIRGRAVICKVPAKDKAKTLTVRCSLARQDLSLWMAAQGWAKPTKPTEPKIAKAAEQARKKKIGIWR